MNVSTGAAIRLRRGSAEVVRDASARAGCGAGPYAMHSNNRSTIGLALLWNSHGMTRSDSISSLRVASSCRSIVSCNFRNYV